MFGFGKKTFDEGSSKRAFERLTLTLQKDRDSNSLPYLEDMKKDIMNVIKKYANDGEINVKSSTDNMSDLLEVEITVFKQ
jgi:cell division topological specificity factor